MKILMHCDSNRAIGMGHVARVSALVEESQARGHEIAIAGDLTNSIAIDMITATGAEVLWGEPLSASKLANIASSWGADMVHIDSYAVMPDLYGHCHSRDILLSSIEDSKFGRRKADVNIDPTPEAEKRFRLHDGARSHLRGADFIPLRLVATSNTNVRETPHRVGSVLISVGGTDAMDQTRVLAQLWGETRLPSTCYVLGQEITMEIRDSYSWVNWIPLDRNPEIAASFGSFDLVIGASGTTLWELAHAGVPSAVLQVANNQSDYYRFAIESGLSIGLGSVLLRSKNSPVTTEIVSGLREFSISSEARQRAIDFGTRLVDGLGASRIINEWERIRSLKNALDAVSRPAVMSDASILFEWRTDNDVSKMSRNPSNFSFESHVNWLRNVLECESRHLLIIEDSFGLLGSARFDFLTNGCWEISITVSPERRGTGLGKQILASAEEWLVAAEEGCNSIRAVYKHSNAPSRRLFESSGYVLNQTFTSNAFEWSEAHKIL